MGNTCACIQHSEVVVSGSEKGGLVKSAHDETAPPSLAGNGGSSSGGAHVRRGGRESFEWATWSGKVRSDVEERIESSMSHWSEVPEPELKLTYEEVARENRQVFEELQSHPTWGGFFMTFGYDTKDWQRSGELVVEEKFAEGGQAELFHAKVIWENPRMTEGDLEEEYEWVLKVFKKGSRLHELRSQWPDGYLQWWAQDSKRCMANLPPEFSYRCNVYCGLLLEDGRFAFLMRREHDDLRIRIDRVMLDTKGDQGPFLKDEVERIMYRIAQGMDWLHSHNIVHRDLKSANVLVYQEDGYTPTYYVADFECSIGVVGTGFFRAPEILQALKDKVLVNNSKVFSKEADVYSYGMTCYEVLTGKLPFHGHRLNDYDLVLNGHRPRILEYIESWMGELLSRCWDVDCSKRPSFQEILEILSSNSAAVRKVQLKDQKDYEALKKRYKEILLQRGLAVGQK